MKKKKYNIEGLDCANCARELEEAITKIDGVSSVVINFMMQKMEISYDEENEKEILSNLKKMIKKDLCQLHSQCSRARVFFATVKYVGQADIRN